MSHAMILLLVSLVVALLVACVVGLLTGILAWMGGANLPNAVLRAGVAVGGTLTLIAVIVGFLTGATHS